MNDETPIRVRRFCVYALIIVIWALLLVFLTGFFWACHIAKTYFQVP